ncbi:hypothetical protein [Streptomyces sp. NBC_00470]|uniref:hypothetical protein n=1 Tax=Streptomyces sp. NBC_00470 TaxID=2975753 RepID=UPI0030DEB043
MPSWSHNLRGCPDGAATVADWVTVRAVDGWRITVQLVHPRKGEPTGPFTVDVDTLSNYSGA